MTFIYTEDGYKIEDAWLKMELAKQALSRRMFTPVQVADITDTLIEYHEIYDDFRFELALDDMQLPASEYEIAPQTKDLPLIQTQVRYTINQVQRMLKDGKFTLDDRNRRTLTTGMPLHEDYYLVGGAPASTGLSVTSFDDTSNNSKTMTTSLDFSSPDEASDSIGAAISELEDNLDLNNAGLKQFPLILAVTSDVYQAGNGNRETSGGEFLTEDVIETVQSMLEKSGGPGSQIIETDLLGATITKNEDGQWSVTAGTTNAVLYAYSQDFQRLLHSNIVQRVENHPRLGYFNDISMRSVPVFIEQNAHLYDDSVTIS